MEDIQSGELVLSWNEKTGEVHYSKVQQTFIREAKEIYKLTYTDGTVIETTWSHPFYILGKGWTKAQDLRAGDISVTVESISLAKVKDNELVMLAAGKTTESTKTDQPKGLSIQSIEILEGERVYNFSVEENHNYFVSKTEVLVHNEEYAVKNQENVAAVLRSIENEQGVKLTKEQLRELELTSANGKFQGTAGERMDSNAWDGFYPGDKIDVPDNGFFDSIGDAIRNPLDSLGSLGQGISDAYNTAKDKAILAYNQYKAHQRDPVTFNVYARDKGINTVEENQAGYKRGYEKWEKGTFEGKPYENVLVDPETHQKVYRTLNHETGVYEVAGTETLSNELYQKELASGGYQGPHTYCNIAASTIGVKYGAPNLQYFGGHEYNANQIYDNLANHAYDSKDGSTGFDEVTDPAEAQRLASEGAFVVATKYSPPVPEHDEQGNVKKDKDGNIIYQPGIGHIATLTGGYKDGQSHDLGNINIFQAGRSYGPMTLEDGFGPNGSKAVKFYVYRKRK